MITDAVALPVHDATPASFEDAVTMGMHLLAHAEDLKWGMGDLLVALVNDSTPRVSETEKQARTRINQVIRKFAEAIKAVNRNTLKGYFEVADFYVPSVRGKFPTQSWSAFREGYRSRQPIAKVLARLAEADANDWPVGTLRRALAGADSADTVTRRRVYDVGITDPKIAHLRLLELFPYDNYQSIVDLMDKPGFACKLTVSWQESRETVTA